MGREGGNDSDKRRVSSPQVFFFSLLYCTLLQKIIINILPYKSRGLGQAKPGPSRIWWLWLGLGFEKAKAGSGQAKAGAFRPSQSRGFQAKPKPGLSGQAGPGKSLPKVDFQVDGQERLHSLPPENYQWEGWLMMSGSHSLDEEYTWDMLRGDEAHIVL